MERLADFQSADIEAFCERWAPAIALNQREDESR
jgi:hypothetical protein